MKQILNIVIGMFLIVPIYKAYAEEITPYKCNGYQEASKLLYEIPSSSRHIINRDKEPDIVYYLNIPKNADSYPIAIICGGSSTKNDIISIIHFHRYFLQEFLDLGIAVITVEQRGVDGKKIDKEEFMAHYTRSGRLKDHQKVVEYLKRNPTKGWNGKFIFLGVSEGGPIVTRLTEIYNDSTLATINWCGAAGWSWREELWTFIDALRKNAPWWMKIWDFIPKPKWISCGLPKTKIEYDQIMDATLVNPSCDQEFMGMTYRYHADALTYPNYDYHKIKTPFLVVAGEQDSIIFSCDAFVQKAQEANMKITYLRVKDMDHYIRRRPDIVKQSFEWLENQIITQKAINNEC